MISRARENRLPETSELRAIRRQFRPASTFPRLQGQRMSWWSWPPEKCRAGVMGKVWLGKKWQSTVSKKKKTCKKRCVHMLSCVSAPNRWVDLRHIMSIGMMGSIFTNNMGGRFRTASHTTRLVHVFRKSHRMLSDVPNPHPFPKLHLPSGYFM